MIVSADAGLLMVFEGKRTHVRVFRRFFYPVQVKEEDIEVLVYSDTGRERVVTYKSAEVSTALCGSWLCFGSRALSGP